ncbi:MAG: prepilin-type N-terminal cleavage/methylation domain-containing protein [Planctomycetota bacterium]|nr:MAG: prepilin-type N-terminal cleavage/methylation domain-containing protein [Planctomycetota bacterium]
MDCKQKRNNNCQILTSERRFRTIRRRLGIRNQLSAGCYVLCPKPAFSLLEVIAALVILAIVSSSALVVINRCMASAADSALRMQAFEVARENMEKLLTSDSVSETTEYGTSDKYSQIQWQTIVGAFYEPVTTRMWVQATCSAEYTDSAGEQQTVELTHWLTDLTKEQMLEILQQQEKELSAEQIIETIEEAAEYAGVDVETIEQWVENGMPVTEDGYYIKNMVDLYKDNEGNPSIEDINRVAQADADLRESTKEQDEQTEEEQRDVAEPTEDETEESDTALICGYTVEELMQMDFEQIWEIISNCDQAGR